MSESSDTPALVSPAPDISVRRQASLARMPSFSRSLRPASIHSAVAPVSPERQDSSSALPKFLGTSRSSSKLVIAVPESPASLMRTSSSLPALPTVESTQAPSNITSNATAPVKLFVPPADPNDTKVVRRTISLARPSPSNSQPNSQSNSRSTSPRKISISRSNSIDASKNDKPSDATPYFLQPVANKPTNQNETSSLPPIPTQSSATSAEAVMAAIMSVVDPARKISIRRRPSATPTPPNELIHAPISEPAASNPSAVTNVTHVSIDLSDDPTPAIPSEPVIQPVLHTPSIDVPPIKIPHDDGTVSGSSSNVSTGLSSITLTDPPSALKSKQSVSFLHIDPNSDPSTDTNADTQLDSTKSVRFNAASPSTSPSRAQSELGTPRSLASNTPMSLFEQPQFFNSLPFPMQLRASPWVPDHCASECYFCTTPFTLFHRRHHCRACGQVFCDECAAFSATVDFSNPHPAAPILGHPGIDRVQFKVEVNPVRVCRECAFAGGNVSASKLPSGSCVIA